MEDGSSTSFWQRLRRGLAYIFRRKQPSADIEREIQELIDMGEQKGLLSVDEGEMIQSILTFRDTVAREIMIPRTDAVTIRADIPVQDLLEIIMTEGHSRLPVYTDNIDNIIGILHVKDLLSYWGQEQVDLTTLLRQPYFIPETKNISLLLKEMRDRKSHMAIVIDEYGGFAGLITTEDIIEEIVGEIEDEHDIEQNWIVPVSEGELLVDARLDMDELADYFNIEVPEGDFESVGGFIISLLGRVPRARESVTYGPLHMIIDAADARKIQKVRVKLVKDEHQERGDLPG